MSKYLKLFETTSQYEAYMGGEKILPNVSLIEETNKVEYNPYVPPITIVYKGNGNVEMPILIKTIDVQTLYYTLDESSIIKMTLDGNNVSLTDFAESGGSEYKVYKYTFHDYNEHTLNIETTTQTMFMFGGVPWISQYASIESIKAVVIPNSITSIGSYAFVKCTNLTSITIPNSVTSIGYHAFSHCSNLTSITIPDSVTEIYGSAFQNSSSLANVTVYATTPPSLGNTVFDGNASGRKIYVPAASVEIYKSASGWSTYASDIEAIPTA